MADPLSLETAQERLLALAKPLPIERVDVPGALGRYLAEPLTARRTQPPAAVSAMDGYAVRASDLGGPWRIVGESAAGHPWTTPVRPGEAVRISTGAHLPPGADAVIVQEDTQRTGSTLILHGDGPPPPQRHVRQQGCDFRCNAELLPAGTRIGPAQIGLALAAGHKHLAVRRRPRIAILDSGDELAADPENCPAHQIPASNGAMIAALTASLPVDVIRLGPIPDRREALVDALASAAAADIVVTTGGASVGDHDLIRPALTSWGAALDFWKVAIKPGKPLLVATKDSQIVLGLPGNPVSSMVTAYLFLLPLLRALLGSSRPRPLALPQPLAVPLGPTGNRREFLRARFTSTGLVPVSSQDSGALGALAATEALLDRPPHAPPLPAGSEVLVYLLANGGLA